MQDNKQGDDTQMREPEPVHPKKPEAPTPPSLNAEDVEWKIFTH